jgi:hypothetical protein
MDREIKIKITPEGKVEIDSSVFEDCKEVAAHFSNLLGNVEEFSVKDEHEVNERLKIKREE